MQQTSSKRQFSKNEGFDSSTLIQRFAQHWAIQQWNDVTHIDQYAVRVRLLDTLAAGLAGTDTEEAQAVVQGMATVYGNTTPHGAVLWGTQFHLPAPQAALVNGTTAHARELDDFDGCGHTGAVVIPAVCAIAQASGASGATVLTAIAAGYDLAGRMLNAAGGYRPHNGLGWHSTATCGTFGAALAAARVLGLDPIRTAHALGIAGSYMGGVWAFMQDGAMTKRMHPGKAAETGVAAAYLAQAGMTGPSHILEAEWGGFFTTYCGPHAQPELLLKDLGNTNAISITGIKPYACCRASHGAIDALLQLRMEHQLTSGDIKSIDVHCPPHTVKLVGSHRVSNVLERQMSMPYALAIAAQTGRADLTEFASSQSEHHEVQRLLAHITLHPNLPADHVYGPLIEVNCTDGRSLQAQVSFAKGHPNNPMNDGELRAKAQSLVVPKLGAERFTALEQSITELHTVDDFRTFAALLQPVQ